MPGPLGVHENLRFLILEVRKQLGKTRQYFADPSGEPVDSVFSKDDYIDTLKGVIQRKCFTLATQESHKSQPELDHLKAIDIIAVNLERIADFCESILDQARYIQDGELFGRHGFLPFFHSIESGLNYINPAVFKHDMESALGVCRAEDELDRLYVHALQQSLRELKEGHEPQTLVTIIFMYRYLERMGDSLLNIGEAVLSCCLGESIKIDQFQALDDSLESSTMDHSIEDVALEPIAETRSGCRIGRVRSQRPDKSRFAIFKEGAYDKLLNEKENIERWRQVAPDLVPQIFSFHQRGDSGSILFEYLPGRTFDEILLRGDNRELDAALDALTGVLSEIWTATRRPAPATAGFLDQLAKRLPDIYALHPEFYRPGTAINRVPVPSLEELIEKARPIDTKAVAPFSVLIHGDLNIDNIIYRSDDGKLHFIDLHRSRMMDYAQDVSVFLVSNLRLPIPDPGVQRKVNRSVERVHDFALDFARNADDPTFSARLALGLARSLCTSTRFVLDRSFAMSMFLRARYLLEHLIHGDQSAKPGPVAKGIGQGFR
ncbi:MAG: phosphotransferase, partial [Candidatus Eisenbacteria bacterium]|nr:phosphotransferase [Candidatus Eisenbacteria bacterium]